LPFDNSGFPAFAAASIGYNHRLSRLYSPRLFTMYSRFHVVMVASVLLLVVFLLAAWHGMQRQQAYEEHAFTVGRTTLKAAASEIESMVRNLQDRIQLFAREYRTDISELAQNTDDDQARVVLSDRLSSYFPHYFAFTISDSDGRPLLEDIDSMVGPLCQQDLQHYSELVVTRGAAYRNPPVLHPLPDNFHFDVMAPWRARNGSGVARGVFFVSFRPALLTEVLRRHSLPDYQLMVVQQDQPTLIEASARGSRDQLVREGRLDEPEMARISQTRSVEGTGWKLVLLPDEGLEAKVQRSIWTQVSVIVGGVLMLAVLVLLASAWMNGRSRQ